MIRFLSFLLFLLCCHSPMGMAQGKKDMKDYWIDKYLSVSFPLESIRINSTFGSRVDPFTGKHKQHKGLDLRARYEEVLSMFDGYVKGVGYDSGSGKYITMQYGDYTVSYCHLSEIWVSDNQKVYAGDPIGISGTTGRSTGPHLHITCRLRGRLEDPYDLLLYIKETREKAIKALKIDEDKVLTPDDFIKHYAQAAMRQQRKYGIPASDRKSVV